MSEIALKIESLNKSFKEKEALKNISLEIPKGKIFGLIGHNGAGKTTLLRIITQIIEQDTGTIFFEGEALHSSHRYKIGYLPEERGLYKKMKVGEYLIFLAELHYLEKKEAKERVLNWLKKLKVEDYFNVEILSLSKGNQQKIQFIATVFFDPELLILDEPFSGFDPSNVELIKSEIIELNNSGTTILFSAHQMETIEEICEDIALINHGEIVVSGSLNEIKENYSESKIYIELREDIKLLNEWTSVPQGSGYLVSLREGQTAKDLLNYISSYEVMEFRIMKPTLREIFLKVMG